MLLIEKNINKQTDSKLKEYFFINIGFQNRI